MGKSFIVVSSITYAMKAKQLLGNYGIKSKVIRTPKHNQNQSCTYTRHLSELEPGQKPYCLIDYFPKDFIIMIDESHVMLPQLQCTVEPIPAGAVIFCR